MANKRNPNYNGYQYAKVEPNSPYYPMTYNGNVAEHRLVMAMHLGRCLKPSDVVHHINGKKNDNRLENLVLVECNGTHTLAHRILRKTLTTIQNNAYKNGIE